MDRELSTYMEQLMTLFIMGIVITLSAGLIYLGQDYMSGTYEYVDRGTSHIRDGSFEKKYSKFITETHSYPVASIVHEFNQMDYVQYNVRYNTNKSGYPKVLTTEAMGPYYHLKGYIKSNTSQDPNTGLVTVFLVLE